MHGQVTCRECRTRGCPDLFDRLLALEFERPEPYGMLHGVTVPAWFLQHPDRAPEGSRIDHWALLHVFAREGLDGLQALARRRREANSHRSRGGLPRRVPASGRGRARQVPGATLEPPGWHLEVADLPPVPDEVPIDVTIADVAGDARDFPAEGHERRVRSWVAAIIAPVA